jgi:flagellar protein FliS
MFGNQGYAAASRRYAAVDAGSKVEGATPHQLVKILFDELMLSIEASAIALRAGDGNKARDRQTRALTMLHALESSLDHQKGGEIAANLGVIYREVRRRVLSSVSSRDPDMAMGGHAIIADIAGAWSQIG